MMPGRKMARRVKPMLRTVSSFMPITRTYRNRLRAVLPTAESRQNWAIPASWQPRANAPTTPSSSRFNSSSLQRIDPEPTPTQLTALTGPWLKTSRARAAVRSAKSAAPVSRTTLRIRDRAAIGFLVTITTSRHSGIASSSATAAPPAEAVPFHQSRSTQTLRHSLDNRITGRRGNDPREFPSRRFQQFAEFWFSAFASAGENQHLQIQEFSGREVVARLNHAIYHQQLSAGICALAAGF